MSQYSLYVRPKPSYAWLIETSLTGPCPSLRTSVPGIYAVECAWSKMLRFGVPPAPTTMAPAVGRSDGQQPRRDAAGSSGPARGSEEWSTGAARPWIHVRACATDRAKECRQRAGDSWDVPPGSRAWTGSPLGAGERIIAHRTGGTRARDTLGGWCRTGVYGAGVIDSDGREWFNGCSSFCQSCWW